MDKNELEKIQSKMSVMASGGWLPEVTVNAAVAVALLELAINDKEQKEREIRV